MNESDAKPEGYAEVWAELPTLIFFAVGQGRFACVSTSDALEITRLKWRVVRKSGKSYVFRTELLGKTGTRRRCGRPYYHRKTIYLHRLLNGFPSGFDVDHRNGNPLNNHRSNLRVATHADNMKNYGRCGLTGIKRLDDGTYQAKLKNRVVGRFTTKAAACAARDAAAQKLRGEFAFTHNLANDGGQEVYNSKGGRRGVYPQRSGRKFSVVVNGKHICSCADADSGASIYDLAALRLWGDRARLNFPDRRPEYLKQLEAEKASA